MASASKTAAKNFREKIKLLEIHKKTGCKIDNIAKILNPMIRGWMGLSAIRKREPKLFAH